MLKWATDRLVKRDFIKLGIDGTWIVMTPHEACNEIRFSSNPGQYGVQSVRMTMHEYGLLPESGGY